jgi:hypothetical protein
VPLGADIILHEKGFRFTPYYIWSLYKGRRWRLRCTDENLIDEDGAIQDTIRMTYFGLPVATMRLTVVRASVLVGRRGFRIVIRSIEGLSPPLHSKHQGPWRSIHRFVVGGISFDRAESHVFVEFQRPADVFRIHG